MDDKARSAELHSAVSQNCILRGVSQSEHAGTCRRPADWKSAIPQIENLRYGSPVDLSSIPRSAQYLAGLIGEDALLKQKFCHSLFSVAASWSSNGPFPLTRSLSPRERETASRAESNPGPKKLANGISEAPPQNGQIESERLMRNQG